MGIFDPKKEPAVPHKVAAYSSILGTLVGVGAAVAAFTWPNPGTASFGLYVASSSVFHLSEFYVTAKYNPRDLTLSSFLLTNGIEYAAAQAAAITEAVVTLFLGNPSYASSWAKVGLVMVIAGQYLRTKAMIQAAQSFSHLVASEKKSDHTLVTSGLYSWFRHPSYLGYFLWAVGTQVMMCNRICTVLFTATLWTFFRQRINHEERLLVEFFGDDYVNYKKSVWSGIPFC